MSIRCKKCSCELPEEASFCLNCMTPVARNENENSEINIKNLTVKERLLSVIKEFSARVISLSKKQKVALISALALLLILVPFSILMFSPTNSAGNTADTAANGNSANDKPIARIESIIDNVFGTNLSEDSDSTSGGTDSTVSLSENVISNSDSASSQTAEETNLTTANSANKNSTTNSNTSNSNSANSNVTSNSVSTGTTDSSSEPVLNYDDWEYTINNSKVTLTKYTGNDKNIIVPDKFEGANLYSVSNGTFKDNKTLETVTFKDSEDYHVMTVSGSAFDNCSSLKKVSFPKNTNLGIYAEFAVNCPKFSDIEISFSQYRFIEGGLYDSNGSTWVLKQYCEGYTASTYDVPSWCTNISAASRNLSNNKYLKTINIHANCYAPSKQWNYYEYRSLENINVASGSSYYLTINGVLYDKSGSSLKLRIYPAGKKDKTYSVPENCTIDCYGMKDDLFENIETIILPASSTISSSTLEDILDYYPSLKTIKIEKGHPKYQTYKNTLDKLVDVNEY